ncbi:MAG: DMT family transporter [Hyphomonas sp.]|uniref:DMT family transporter n=1 Tax=Hyphomonas sp. TaxID=87 RepID=UPI00352864C7
MELWIPVTIAAAFLQNLRSMLQKSLKGRLSTWGATATRFIYAAPFAVLLFTGIAADRGGVPAAPAEFFLYGMAGGLAQILATALLISLFSRTNFAVATAFTRTEPLQTAVFGFVLLGEHVSAGAVAGILVSLVGVILISVPGLNVRSLRQMNVSVWRGVVSGGLFGLSAIAYRSASLSLPGEDVLLRSSATLAFVTVFQAVAMLAWLTVKERGEATRVLVAWKVAIWVGIAGVLGSFGWFTAFTLERAAYVRALGQVEVIFTLMAAILFFRERLNLREIAGAVLIAAGVVGLLVLR